MMTAPANLALRAFYILAGIALIVYSLLRLPAVWSFMPPRSSAFSSSFKGFRALE